MNFQLIKGREKMLLALERMDFGDEADLDITGENYRMLINACFDYAPFFSSTIFEADIPELRPYIWRVQVEEDCFKPGKHYKTVYYHCCQGSKDYLCQTPHSLFYWKGSWLTPENLCFYRADGSILLRSIAHDQDCYVYLQGEDINKFLPIAPWRIAEIEK